MEKLILISMEAVIISTVMMVRRKKKWAYKWYYPTLGTRPNRQLAMA